MKSSTQRARTLRHVAAAANDCDSVAPFTYENTTFILRCYTPFGIVRQRGADRNVVPAGGKVFAAPRFERSDTGLFWPVVAAKDENSHLKYVNSLNLASYE